MTEVLRAVGRRTSILAAGESDTKGCSARAASRVARYPNCPVAKWRPFSFLPTSRRFLLTTNRGRVRTSPSRSLRGVSGDILKAERGVASCDGRLVTVCPGRPGTPPARHYDLAARSSL